MSFIKKRLKFPPLIFRTILRRIGVKFSLSVWYNSAVKSSGPGLFFIEWFFIIASISLTVIGLLRCPISS